MIERVAESMRRLLIEKNRGYGNAALNQKNVFGKPAAGEAIKTRPDDKSCRITANEEEPGKNDVADLTGYLVLFRAYRGRTEFSDLID